jgi:hypothetical protein
MTTTDFYFPQTIQQVSVVDNSLSWNDDFSLDSKDNFNSTEDRLYRIPRTDRQVTVNYAKQLWCTNFNFANIGTIQGIELELRTQRLARIQDYVIQLTYDGELVGDNLYNDKAENYQLYGGSSVLWGRSWISAEAESSSFGVVIQLGPNKSIPHKDTGYIDSVALRIYYV